MNNIYNRQRLLGAIDDYLLVTPVAPGFTPAHLNSTKDLLRFIVAGQNDEGNSFIKTFNHHIAELNKWENELYEKNDLAYTILAMRIQKELRRFKDVYLLEISG